MLNLYNLQNNGSKESVVAVPEQDQKKADYTKYISRQDGLSAGGLKWGMWFTSHKATLYKLLIVILLVINAFLIIFSLIKWGDFILKWNKQKSVYNQLASAPNYSIINQGNVAKPLQVLGVQVLASGVDKQDIIAEISNPNTRFVVFFDYYFVSQNNTTTKQTTFILPQQTRPVTMMGVKENINFSSPNLVMENVSWKRVNPHTVNNVASWQKEHLDFAVTDFQFVQSYSAAKDRADAHIIQFQLTNKSPYDYIEPQFIVGLYQGGSFAGVMPLFLNEIKTLQKIKVDLRSFVNGLVVDEIRIHPIINIYNEEAYISKQKI